MSIVDVRVLDSHLDIRVNRPERRNALGIELASALQEAITNGQEHARPLVITSSTPGMFIAGADISQFVKRTLGDVLSRKNSLLYQSIEDYPWPTVALVDGPALGGGCELAMACDFRVAATTSTWGLPEVRLGLIPGGGGLWRLPRLVGWGRAVDLIMTGRVLTGDEAHECGLVQYVVPSAELAHKAAELIDQLNSASGTALRLAKEAMRVPADHRRAIDALAQGICLEAGDARPRLQAFLDKRASR